MRHRYVQIVTAVLLVFALAGLVFANSESARLRVETALYYISNGWMAEALEHLQQAVRVAPDYAEAHLLLALLLDSFDESERALRSYERVMELAPDSAPYGVLVGDLYFSRGMLNEAEAAYERAIRAFPDAGLAYYGLGRVLELRDAKAAVATLRTAVDHAPDFIDARFRLGRLLRQNGEFTEALEHLLHANRLDSRQPAVRMELALTYEALHRTSEAEHEYRMVLRLDPNNEEASSRLQRLLEAPRANS